MNLPLLSSTFFLTLLMFVGLFFFIRASIKDRTEQTEFQALLPETRLLERLEAYFNNRAYRLTQIKAQEKQITFEGFVQPSWFLAILLTLLAAVGFLCLALILSFPFSNIGNSLFLLVLLAPVAGIFYWQGAGRTEQVRLQIQPSDPTTIEEGITVQVTAHRDELRVFKAALPALLDS